MSHPTPGQLALTKPSLQQVKLLEQLKAVKQFLGQMEQLTALIQLVIDGMVLTAPPIGQMQQAQQFTVLMGLPTDKEATLPMVLTVQVAEPPHQDGTLTAIKIMEILTIILTLWILLD